MLRWCAILLMPAALGVPFPPFFGNSLPSFYTYNRYRFQLPGVPRIGGLPPLFGTIVRSTRSATVDFQEAGDSGVSGQVTIQEIGDGTVLIEGSVFGLTSGKHGFHVHQKGQLGNGCKDAGGHFNPFEKTHGSPDGSERHVGDLGNVVTPVGSQVTTVFISDSLVSLDPESEAYVGGRAIVIHGGEDDLGGGGDEGSLKTGNAGPRVACGIIQVEEHEDEEHEMK